MFLSHLVQRFKMQLNIEYSRCKTLITSRNISEMRSVRFHKTRTESHHWNILHTQALSWFDERENNYIATFNNDVYRTVSSLLCRLYHHDHILIRMSNRRSEKEMHIVELDTEKEVIQRKEHKKNEVQRSIFRVIDHIVLASICVYYIFFFDRILWGIIFFLFFFFLSLYVI
jgi:ABC-type multidrug transport system fused ATPase/permease subunit